MSRDRHVGPVLFLVIAREFRMVFVIHGGKISSGSTPSSIRVEVSSG